MNEAGCSLQRVWLPPAYIHIFTQQTFPEPHPPTKSWVLGKRSEPVTTLILQSSHSFPYSAPLQYDTFSGSPSPSIHLNIYWAPAICQALEKCWGHREIKCELPGVTDTSASDSIIVQYEIRWYCENRGQKPPTQSWGQKWLPEEISTRLSYLLIQWQVLLPLWESISCFLVSACPHVTPENSNLPNPGSLTYKPNW